MLNAFSPFGGASIREIEIADLLQEFDSNNET